MFSLWKHLRYSAMPLKDDQEEVTDYLYCRISPQLNVNRELAIYNI